MDDFFAFVSKAVIVIPIVVVILSLMFKFNRTNKPVSSYYQLINPTVTLMPTNKMNINFDGPLICRYKNDDQKYNLFVKNRKIILEVKTGSQTKKYDLSSYLSFFEGMLNNGSANLDSLVSQYLGKKVDIKMLYKLCKKEDF